MINCNKCGKENSSYDAICVACKHPLDKSKKKIDKLDNQLDNDDAVMALVYGVISLLFLGMVFGPMAVKRGVAAENDMGKAGKILGMIGFSVWCAGLFAILIVWIMTL